MARLAKTPAELGKLAGPSFVLSDPLVAAMLVAMDRGAGTVEGVERFVAELWRPSLGAYGRGQIERRLRYLAGMELATAGPGARRALMERGRRVVAATVEAVRRVRKKDPSRQAPLAGQMSRGWP